MLEKKNLCVENIRALLSLQQIISVEIYAILCLMSDPRMTKLNQMHRIACFLK